MSMPAEDSPSPQGDPNHAPDPDGPSEEAARDRFAAEVLERFRAVAERP